MLDINLIAVLVTVIACMFVGWLWFSPYLFGKIWAEKLNMDYSTMKPTPIHMLGAMAIVLIISLFFGGMVSYLDLTTVKQGITLAIVIWTGFIATSHFSAVIWTKKPVEVYLIEVGCHFMYLLIMGIIFPLLG